MTTNDHVELYMKTLVAEKIHMFIYYIYEHMKYFFQANNF